MKSIKIWKNIRILKIQEYKKNKNIKNTRKNVAYKI